MKEILTNNITSNARQPFIKRTFTHLQESYTELFSAFFEGLLKSSALTSVVNLGVVLDSNNFVDWTITEGWVYVPSEKKFFFVESGVLNTPLPNIPVLQLSADEFSVDDPVEFSDQTTHNVHLNKKAEFVSGLAGSGLADYDQMVDFNESLGIELLDKVGRIEIDPNVGLSAGRGIDNGAGVVREKTITTLRNFQPPNDNILINLFVAYDKVISYDVLLRNTTSNKTYKVPLFDNAGTLEYEATLEETGGSADLRLKMKVGGFFDSVDNYDVLIYVKYLSV